MPQAPHTQTNPPKNPKIQIVGAGFSGLAMAYWLSKRRFDITVVEKSNRPGGLLGSERIDGTLVESAANGFVWNDDFARLELDLGIRFQETLASSRRRYIYRKSSKSPSLKDFRRWPLTPGETIGFIPRLAISALGIKPNKRESIDAWVNRALGPSALSYLIEPILQGIYAGDVNRMSASLIFGRLFDRKKKKEALPSSKTKTTKRRGTHSHIDGMGGFCRDLQTYLEKQGVKFQWGKQIDSAKPGEAQILAVNPHIASKLVAEDFPEVAQSLSEIELRGVASTTMVFSSPGGEQGMPSGFGILFPRSEGYKVLGILRNHHIFAGRSARVSETWIYGREDLEALGCWNDDKKLRELILSERAQISGAELEPELQKTVFWHEALPHYTAELEAFLESEQRSSLEQEGIYLFSNYTGQIGLSRIWSAAKELAEKLEERYR